MKNHSGQKPIKKTKKNEKKQKQQINNKKTRKKQKKTKKTFDIQKKAKIEGTKQRQIYQMYKKTENQEAQKTLGK